MNTIEGKILAIASEGSIHSVSLEALGSRFEVVTLDLDAGFAAGNSVLLMFKETEVAILLGDTASVSIANVLESRIEKITGGVILSEVFLDIGGAGICSIVSSKAVSAMGLREGMRVKSMIKASDISMEIP